MMGELARALKEAGKSIADSPVSPERLAELLALVERGTLSGAMAKGVFETMIASGRAASAIVEAEGLAQIDDDTEILALVADVLARNADAVAQFRSGKASALGFLVGQVMKSTGGKANPKRVNAALQKALQNGVG
jgi:aspartyl-tRNA(Asn)/glutamyl-tRNA(Gln) amidotransferase subunit B